MTRPDLHAETTRDAALRQIARVFEAAGLEDPRREARLALQAALAIEPGEWIARPDALLGPAADRAREIVARRAAREPLSRILGRREFFGIALALAPDTLDPRPDTEILVEAALDHATRRGLATRPARVIDLGTGSGAILAAVLAHLPLAQGVATDISAGALACAAANLRQAIDPGRATLLQTDWWQGVTGAFDLVLSNPPYIATGALAGLDPEVRRFDPPAALDGGGDGLDAYRAIAAGLDAHLAPAGLAMFEVGAGQAPAVLGIFAAHGFCAVEVRRDLGGIERVIVVERSA